MTHIVAILPEEVKGTGICSRVYFENTTTIDTRTPTLYLETMYKKQGRTKKEMDKKIKAYLQINKNLPYQIDAGHVFFGFKYRQAIYDNQGRGFVNVKFVDHIKNTEIVLDTGETIDTLNQKDSLIANMNHARHLLTLEMLDDAISRESTIRYITGRLR